MQTNLREENERIQAKKREMLSNIYENMNAVLNDETHQNGLNAVLKFLHIKESVDDRLPLSEQLKFAEEKFLVKMRYIELDEDWYTVTVVPMLVKTIDGNWLAVIPKADGTCAYIKDNKKIKVTSKNAKLFANNAMYFYKVMKNDKITMRDLFSFMLQCTSKNDRIIVLATSVLTIIAGTLLPWVNNFIFSKIIPMGDLSKIAVVVALILSSVLSSAVWGLLQSLILTNSMLRTDTYIQSAVFSRVLSLRTEFFNNIKSGELSRMITEFSNITKIVSVKGICAFISLFLSLVYLIQIYIYAPTLFGWIILSTLLLGTLLIASGVMSAKWSRKYSKSLSKMSGFCYELFSGIEQIKLNGAETRIMRRWSEYFLNTSRNEDKPILLKYSHIFYRLIMLFTTAVIFLFGTHLAASNYIAFSSAYGAYNAAIVEASVIIQMIAGFRSAYSLINPVLNAECEEYGAEKKAPENLNGEIAISNLYFRYDKDAPYVLNGLSANIHAGESVGIIGTSGCGKSTLIRLLLGFEKAEQGSIYIDGYDIRELDLKSCRRKIGAVLQNTGLISGDIYSNITLTKPNASMDEVNAAIETAGLYDTIAALPMGLHTPISQENCTLSGGQCQRVLIARAIISKPSILIFDEATSALDNITQAKITEGINKLDCTKIIVAHRLSTIEDCDKILVMDKGVIVQEGTLNELKNADGLFQQLIRRQNTCQ